MSPKKYLKDLFQRTLNARTPFQAVAEALLVSREEIDICRQRFSLGERTVYVWAAGKAAIPMFNSIYQCLNVILLSKSLYTLPASPQSV